MRLLIRFRFALVSLVGALQLSTACSSSISEPNVDCSGAVGFVLIGLLPEPGEFFADYEVRIGDSIQVVGSLHRITEAYPTFNVQQGWTCQVTATTQIPGTVNFSTTDTQVVELLPAGWIRGLSVGQATIVATSPQTSSERTFYVRVVH
jgi:hypothetical protein